MQPAFEDIPIHCTIHRQNKSKFLLLKPGVLQRRLLCLECLYSENSYTWNEELAHMLPLSIAIQYPEVLVNKITKDYNRKYLFTILKIHECNLENLFNEEIKKMELIVELPQEIKANLYLICNYCKERQILIQNYRQEFLYKIQYNSLIKLINELKELDHLYLSDQYIDIEKKLSSKIADMLKDNGQYMITCLNQMKLNSRKIDINYSDRIKVVLAQFDGKPSELVKQCETFLEEISTDFALSPLTKEKLIEKIKISSKKEIIQTNLIYQGSKDGLNGEQFWNKVNGKQNLLMIFKTRDNYSFGGYSQCKWDYNLNNYVKDDTSTSFLFSITHNEIYPVKQGGSNAIYCNKGYGPTFGGHDLYIDINFTSGSSSLGTNYQIDYKPSQPANYLFGNAQLNLIECEICELIFA